MCYTDTQKIRPFHVFQCTLENISQDLVDFVMLWLHIYHHIWCGINGLATHAYTCLLDCNNNIIVDSAHYQFWCPAGLHPCQSSKFMLIVQGHALSIVWAGGCAPARFNGVQTHCRNGGWCIMYSLHHIISHVHWRTWEGLGMRLKLMYIASFDHYTCMKSYTCSITSWVCIVWIQRSTFRPE